MKFGNRLIVEPTLKLSDKLVYSGIATTAGAICLETVIGMSRETTPDGTNKWGLTMVAAGMALAHGLTKLRGGYHRDEVVDGEEGDDQTTPEHHGAITEVDFELGMVIDDDFEEDGLDPTLETLTEDVVPDAQVFDIDNYRQQG